MLRILKSVGIAVTAAVLTALPAGVGARLLMRMVAVTETGHHDPITFAGTSGIVIVFAAFAVVAALVMLRLSRRYQAGVIYGLIFAVFPSGGMMLAAEDPFATAGSTALFLLNRVVFLGWFVGYGVLLAAILTCLQHRGSAKPVPSGIGGALNVVRRS